MYSIGRFGLSIRRACRVIGLSRTSFAYRPIVKPDEEAIRKRLKELAQERRRFGYRRLHVMLRREGFAINHKRTEIPKPTHRNHIWSMDFMRDALANGRTIKVLPIADEYTRKCFRIEVDTSINGVRVVRVLDEIGQQEGLPEIIIIDNGPEFIGKALDAWAYARGIKLAFITPGRPVENAYIESFNGRFRDECLNEHWFMTLDNARKIIEEWRVDYNTKRPHSSLEYMTPEEFIGQEMSKVSTPMGVEGRTNTQELLQFGVVQ